MSATAFEPRFTLTDDPIVMLRRMRALGTLNVDLLTPKYRQMLEEADAIDAAWLAAHAEANGRRTDIPVRPLPDGQECPSSAEARCSPNGKRRKCRPGPHDGGSTGAAPEHLRSTSDAATVADAARVGGNADPSEAVADAARVGDNADTPMPAASATGRNSKGQFTAGNRGGPGNPFGRQAALLRSAFMRTATPEKMQLLAAALMEYAIAGDMQAAKLVLNYTIGKPTEAVDPDRVDIEEWNIHKATYPMMGELTKLKNQPLPELPLELLRVFQPNYTDSVRLCTMYMTSLSPKEYRKLLYMLEGRPEEEKTELLKQYARQWWAAGGKDRVRGVAPSTNGPAPSTGGKTPGVAQPSTIGSFKPQRDSRGRFKKPQKVAEAETATADVTSVAFATPRSATQAPESQTETSAASAAHAPVNGSTLTSPASPRSTAPAVPSKNVAPSPNGDNKQERSSISSIAETPSGQPDGDGSQVPAPATSGRTAAADSPPSSTPLSPENPEIDRGSPSTNGVAGDRRV